MCLAAVSLGADPRFPFVIAANRDEYFARASAPLDWWTPDKPGAAPVLAGRDLTAGGTWLALNAAGRLALVTNVREPDRLLPNAPSRGQLPLDWCEGAESTDHFTARVQAGGFNGFNLLAFDGAADRSLWISNRPAKDQAPRAHTAPLTSGLHGLSNAALDTPWPKLLTLRRRLGEALAAGRREPEREGEDAVDALATHLWSALADPSPAPDAILPATGIAIERERLLSPAFIRIAAADDAVLANYGTRSSTLVIVEARGGRRQAHVRERRFDARGRVAGEAAFVIDDWPTPRGSR